MLLMLEVIAGEYRDHSLVCGFDRSVFLKTQYLTCMNNDFLNSRRNSYFFFLKDGTLPAEQNPT